MSISITQRKFLIYITLLTLFLGVVGGVVLQNLVPGRYFEAYPLIPVYFYLYGIGSVFLLDFCRRHAPKRMVMLFMGMKGLKLILSIALLIIYAMLVPHSAVVFMLTFIVFYLCYLIFESWFFFVSERNEKLKKK